jgi:hypothetical protein
MFFSFVYILILIDFIMSYLHQRTQSGHFASNQEEHYPERLNETSVLENPPTYYEVIRGI